MRIKQIEEMSKSSSSTNRAVKSSKSGTSALKSFLLSLGPGIIIAAVVFGPSKMTITSKLGSQYGYSLLWIVVVAMFFMTIFTIMGARIGVATKHSLLTTIRNKWGKLAAVAVGIGIFIVTTSFQAGNSIGVGIAIAEATGTKPLIWIIIFNLIGMALLFFRGFYRVLEKLMIGLVALMLFAFLTTFFLIRPDFASIAGGFVPRLAPGSLGLVIAFFASSFSMVAAFYQSYLVQERIKVNPEIEEHNSNSITGIFILGLMSAIIMICAAAILHKEGINVASASDMSRALVPLFGEHASTLFLIGLFGASFSSLVGNATIGGTLMADSLGQDSDLNSARVKVFIALVMVFGAIIAIRFGRLPLELIVFAQSVTIFLVPFIGLALYAVSNDEKIMGQYKNSPAVKVIGAIGLLILLLLAASNVNELFLK
jgi:manganese transport protein